MRKRRILAAGSLAMLCGLLLLIYSYNSDEWRPYGAESGRKSGTAVNIV